MFLRWLSLPFRYKEDYDAAVRKFTEKQLIKETRMKSYALKHTPRIYTIFNTQLWIHMATMQLNTATLDYC